VVKRIVVDVTAVGIRKCRGVAGVLAPNAMERTGAGAAAKFLMLRRPADFAPGAAIPDT
jgi:hypothetical protein